MDKDSLLKNCTSVKFVLMVCVVLYHACVFWTGHWVLNIEPAISCKAASLLAPLLNSFPIYAFALISGYIFYYIKFEKNGYSSFRKFIVKKVRRLIIPYVFLTLVWVVPLSIFAGVAVPDLELVKTILLCEMPSQLWFLPMLFFIFTLAHPLSSSWKRSTIIGLVNVLAFYAIGEYFIYKGIILFNFSIALSFMIFFFVGFKLRQFPKITQAIVFKLHPVFLILIDALFIALLWFLDTRFFLPIQIAKLALHLITAITSFAILQNIFSRFALHERWNNFASSYTMPIYLFHQPLIYITLTALNGFLHPAANIAINFVFAFLGSITITAILQKSKVLRFLIGE